MRIQGRFRLAMASISRASPRKQAATQRSRPTSPIPRIGVSLYMALVCLVVLRRLLRFISNLALFCALILLEHLFYVKDVHCPSPEKVLPAP